MKPVVPGLRELTSVPRPPTTEKFYVPPPPSYHPAPLVNFLLSAVVCPRDHQCPSCSAFRANSTPGRPSVREASHSSSRRESWLARTRCSLCRLAIGVDLPVQLSKLQRGRSRRQCHD